MSWRGMGCLLTNAQCVFLHNISASYLFRKSVAGKTWTSASYTFIDICWCLMFAIWRPQNREAPNNCRFVKNVVLYYITYSVKHRTLKSSRDPKWSKHTNNNNTERSIIFCVNSITFASYHSLFNHIRMLDYLFDYIR